MLRNVEEVKSALELAAEVDKALPKVKAQGAKALWPDIILTESEIKALKLMTHEGKPDFCPSQADIDLWYKVCTEWIKPFIGDEKKRQQWVVIWLKSCGCPSKIIERKLSICRTKVWYIYDKGMVHLLNFLNIKINPTELVKNEYRPELIKAYPRGKITGMTKINILREWLAELERKNIK